MKANPFHNKSRLCWIGALLMGLLPGHLFAQDADPEARAEAIIDQLLENVSAGTAELQLEIAEDYELSREDDTFTATFEPVTLSDGEFSIALDPITIAITPGADNLSEVDFQMGEAVVISQNDAEVARISIGEQTGQGIWNETLDNFASTDVQLVKLTLEMPDNPMQAELAGLDYSSSLVMEDDQTWTSRGGFQASALTVQGPEGQHLDLGMLSADFSVSGTDYQRFMSFTEELQNLFSAEQMAQMESDPAAGQQVLSTLVELYGFFQGLEGNFTLSDFAVAQGDTALGAFESLSFGIDFNTADTGASLGYSIDLQGLETPMAPVPPGLLPDALRVEVGLDNIPQSLLDRLGELLTEIEGMPPEQQGAMISQELMGLVMQSDLGAYIRETYVAAPDARMDLNLEARVATASPFGAVGDLELVIVGLDQAVAQMGLDQNPEVAPALAMLTAFSNRTEQDSQVVDTFALQVTEDGKLMLNGKDVSAMLMGAGAGAAPGDGESTTE